jgi:short-subunit dehydrogenase
VTDQAPLAFITGASSGIGQALTQHYAAMGWRLGLLVRDAAKIHRWLAGQGLGEERVQVYVADMRDVDAVIAAALACLARQGLPDVVIASAGISVGMDSAEREDLDVLRETFEINNIALAATFHAFITPMRSAGRGKLVGLASVASIRGLPGHGAYCASKAAVVAYCESLRVELAGAGVRVVTILPGFIDTPMTRRNAYRMPFLMPASTFAAQAAQAIERGERRIVIPWQMGWVARLLRILPGWVYDRVIAGRGRKSRRAPEPGSD